MTDEPPSRELSERDRRRSEFLLQTMEARRAQSDAYAWAVPGLAIASQAFLLSIALAPDTRPAGRLCAAVAGLLALLATAHLLAKQAYNFDVYEAVIERERKKLDLPAVQMDELTEHPDSFPGNTQLAKRGWLNEQEHPWLQRLVRRRKAVMVWLGSLGLLAALDLGLVVYSIWAWACGDPGWLAQSGA